MPSFGNPMSHSQLRTSSRKRTLQRCKMKGSLDNIVLIDVESENFPNVIIIDVPESVEQKLRGSRVRRENKKFPLEGIISIEDDGNPDDECNEIGGEDDNVNDDASPSGRSCASSYHFENSMDSFGDECQFLHAGKTPVNLSKCTRTYSANFPPQNYYGLNLDSEESSSESDCSDCEISFREQWENASLKKRRDSHNSQSGSKDQAYASCSDTATPATVENKKSDDQGPEGPTSGACNPNYEEENLAAFMEASFCNLDDCFLHPTVECPEDLRYKSAENREFSCRESDFQDRSGTCEEDATFKHSECQTGDSGYEATFLHEEGQIFEQPYSSLSQAQEHATTSSQNGSDFAEEPCLFNAYPGMSVHCDHGKGNVQGEGGSSGRRHCSVERQADHEAACSRDRDEEFGQTHLGAFSSSCQSKHARHGFQEKENLIFSELSPAQPFDETSVHQGIAFCANKVNIVSEKQFCCQTSSPGMSDVKSDRTEFEGKENSVSEEPSCCNTNCDSSQVKQGEPSVLMDEAPVIKSLCDSEVQDPYPDGDGMRSCIINDREKMKETAEYKRAVEEEWASRQRQLQIQAEEAQRLRRLQKRKRAESMRIMDMERKQKLRVQEMRETQKKDEENMSLKELYRVEIRNELHKMEINCKDLASLLRCLGIHVGGGFFPSSNEVRAAYKRALLKLHPDRASRADIRQQVEAEEKFKLISRMKEKLMLT